ncbi:hypothetical protein Btru_038879 [Bulinus truncatus]|nr:hypothetical protein Btru_038879 [Bulinus truncatus]
MSELIANDRYNLYLQPWSSAVKVIAEYQASDQRNLTMKYWAFHAMLQKINEAYSVLRNPLTRQDYDSILDAEHYVSNHMRSSAYQTHSHTYRPEAGYTYYRNIYNDTNWHESSKESKTFTLINNLLFLTFSLTAVVVSSIFYYMYNFIEDPKVKKLCANIPPDELDKYDLIMTSQHEGTTVYYYALPKENDPNSYEILAVKRDKTKDSELDVLSEITDVYGKRKER